MSAPHNELSDKVATALTALAAGYTAVSAYVPNWTDKNTSALSCAVVPASVESELIDRSSSADTITIDVGFTKRLQDKTKAELDGLSEKAHNAFKHLKPDGAGKLVTLTDGTKCRAIRAAYKAIFDPDKLAAVDSNDASGAFLSVFSVTYRIYT